MLLKRRQEIKYADLANTKKDLEERFSKYNVQITEGAVTLNKGMEPEFIYLHYTFDIPDGEAVPINLPGTPEE